VNHNGHGATKTAKITQTTTITKNC